MGSSLQGPEAVGPWLVGFAEPDCPGGLRAGPGSPGDRSGPFPACSDFQIVAQKKMTRPLLLKFGRNAGKSTITVRLPAFPPSPCTRQTLTPSSTWL